VLAVLARRAPRVHHLAKVENVIEDLLQGLTGRFDHGQ
jgi:hypothetical protein